jgi:hypothetical protein
LSIESTDTVESPEKEKVEDSPKRKRGRPPKGGNKEAVAKKKKSVKENGTEESKSELKKAEKGELKVDASVTCYRSVLFLFSNF